jgi:hypothetical protein
MSITAKIFARVRGLFALNSSENREDEQVIINNRGDLVVAQSLPELTEIVRLGNSYQVASTTGLAALTALPTTTSGLSITNNEGSSGKCLLIDSFGSWEAVVDATQTDVTAIFAMINKTTPTQANPSGGTAETGIVSLSGKSNYGGKATALRGATVANNGWFAHGSATGQMAAAAAGANWKVNEVSARGLYLIPPGSAFSIQAVKAAAAAALDSFFFIRWHEVQLIYAT